MTVNSLQAACNQKLHVNLLFNTAKRTSSIRWIS
nr:hypothetical protein [Sphingobacterium sp. E70]